MKLVSILKVRKHKLCDYPRRKKSTRYKLANQKLNNKINLSYIHLDN